MDGIIKGEKEKISTGERRYPTFRQRGRKRRKGKNETVGEMDYHVGEKSRKTTETHSCIVAVTRRMRKKTHIAEEGMETNDDGRDIQTQVKEEDRLENDRIR